MKTAAASSVFDDAYVELTKARQVKMRYKTNDFYLYDPLRDMFNVFLYDRIKCEQDLSCFEMLRSKEVRGAKKRIQV